MSHVPTSVSDFLARALKPRAQWTQELLDGQVHVDGGVATMVICGNLQGGPETGYWNTKGLAYNALRLAKDPSVRAVALHMASDGGDAAVLPDIVEAFSILRDSKPVYAYVEAANSAGYLLASFAARIYIAPTGRAGSIGVAMGAVDMSKNFAQQGLRGVVANTQPLKGPGDLGTPIDAAQEEYLRRTALNLEKPFIEAVAANRGISPAAIAAMQGAVFIGQDAVGQKLADAVVSLGTFYAMVHAAAASFTGSAFPNRTAPLAGSARASATSTVARAAAGSALATAKGTQAMSTKSRKTPAQIEAATAAAEAKLAAAAATAAASTATAESEVEVEVDPEEMTAATLAEKYPELVKEIQDSAVATAKAKAEAEAKAAADAAVSADPKADKAAEATAKAPASITELTTMAAKLPEHERNAFVVAQATAKATLGQAKEAYLGVLETKLAAGGTQIAAAGATASAQIHLNTPANVSQTPSKETYEALVIAKAKELKSDASMAMAAVMQERPELYADWNKRGRPEFAGFKGTAKRS